MSKTTDELPAHMAHMTKLKVTPEGIEMLGLADCFYDLGEPVADLQHVIFAGADLYEILKNGPAILERIKERFLEEMKKEAEQAETERRIDNLGNRE